MSYFQLLYAVLEENGLFDKPGSIYNMDETGLQLNNKLRGRSIAAILTSLENMEKENSLRENNLRKSKSTSKEGSKLKCTKKLKTPKPRSDVEEGEVFYEEDSDIVADEVDENGWSGCLEDYNSTT
ncbi:hypothetical protein HHI36_016820 [Cryptolaemus montrouzieri]|uniref:Transposase n=1 Tax=Cryptolaemus montrouzieri TaxID=559131 RepID=A0ABD2NLK8_9CUCU